MRGLHCRGQRELGGTYLEFDAKDQAALDRLVSDLRDLHGQALVAVALTGEAASPAYRPRKSELTTVVVISEINASVLRTVRGKIRAWGRLRLATPLLMDSLYIETSRDVFPIEFLDLRERHRLLFGEVDPFADLAIDVEHLRLEVEEQLRGKMLHLWEAYLETAGSRRQLRRLLLETPASFAPILRGLLHLRQMAGQAGAPSGDLLADVEGAVGVTLPVFRRLLAVQHGDAALGTSEHEEVFEGYLAEVRRLVRVSDAR